MPFLACKPTQVNNYFFDPPAILVFELQKDLFLMLYLSFCD